MVQVPLPGEGIDLIVGVEDGEPIRLWGIAAPVPPFDAEARMTLAKLVAIQGHRRPPWMMEAKPTIIAHVLERGREGRALVHLYDVQDDAVLSINEALVAEGLACPSGDYGRFARADARARAEARGIYRG